MSDQNAGLMRFEAVPVVWEFEPSATKAEGPPTCGDAFLKLMDCADSGCISLTCLRVNSKYTLNDRVPQILQDAPAYVNKVLKFAFHVGRLALLRSRLKKVGEESRLVLNHNFSSVVLHHLIGVAPHIGFSQKGHLFGILLGLSTTLIQHVEAKDKP